MLPPPITITSLSRKKNPSQVAQADTPNPRNAASPGIAEPARLRAGRDNDRLADVAVARIARCDKRPARQIERVDLVEDDAGSDMLGLFLHLLHQPGTLDDVGETGIVLDIGRDRQLPAGLHPGDHQRLQIGARGVDRGGVPGRPGADNEDPAVMLFGHAALLLPDRHQFDMTI